nr:uncharacterized protein LOC111835717 [Paramormyrops kingsleyae]
MTHRSRTRSWSTSAVKKAAVVYQQPSEKNPQPTAASVLGSRSKENVQIIVEDLGSDNPSFILEEEEGGVEEGGPPGRSGSSVSPRCGARMKRKVEPRSSMVLQQCQSNVASEKGNEVKEEVAEEAVLDEGPLGWGPGAFLLQPVINLIPPTPSADINDQFFDLNSGESPSLGRECIDYAGGLGERDRESHEEEEEKVMDKEALESMQDVEGAEGGEFRGSPSAAIMVDGANISRDDTSSNEEAAERPNLHFFQHSAFKVALLPQYPRKLSFNAGINLLKFTEQDLDDLTNKDVSSHEVLKAQLCLLPVSSKMTDAHSHLRMPAISTCTLGNSVSRSHTFHSISKERISHESPRQRRITVASFVSQPKDQNGNYPREDTGRRCAKALAELDTDEVCQWFANLGLHHCQPFIRGAHLHGCHITAIDQDLLDRIHVSTLEDRERLLSAVYQELHPSDAITQTVDSLLDLYGPHNVEKFTAALASMSKEMFSPYGSHLSDGHPFTFRVKGQNLNRQRNSHLVELSINALGQMVHLRTHRETTVSKVMGSCLDILGVTEDRGLFGLRNVEELSDAFLVDQKIGDLPGSEKRMPELQLYKKDKPGNAETPQLTQQALLSSSQSDADRIHELTQQVESLQDIVQQVQELHQSLVSFYSELKNMENISPAQDQGLAELEKQMGHTKSRCQETQLSIQVLQDQLCHLEASKNRSLPQRWSL